MHLGGAEPQTLIPMFNKFVEKKTFSLVLLQLPIFSNWVSGIVPLHSAAIAELETLRPIRQRSSVRWTLGALKLRTTSIDAQVLLIKTTLLLELWARILNCREMGIGCLQFIHPKKKPEAEKNSSVLLAHTLAPGVCLRAGLCFSSNSSFINFLLLKRVMLMPVRKIYLGAN